MLINVIILLSVSVSFSNLYKYEKKPLRNEIVMTKRIYFVAIIVSSLNEM